MRVMIDQGSWLSQYWWIVLIGIVLIAGISYSVWWYYDHRVYSGEIVEKSYHEPYTTTTTITVNGISVPQIQHYPASWYVTIRGNDKHGRPNTSSWGVTEEYFAKATIGSWFSALEKE